MAEEPTLAGRNRSHGALAAFGAFSLVASVAAAAWLLGFVPERTSAEASVDEPAVGALLAPDPFIVNLADEEGRRYLNAALPRDLFVPPVPDQFNARGPPKP